VKKFPTIKGVKRSISLKSSYFRDIGSFSVKTITDKHQGSQ